MDEELLQCFGVYTIAELGSVNKSGGASAAN
jgi:hypothetical protein